MSSDPSSLPTIQVEDVSKQYRYGSGTEGRLADAVNKRIHRLTRGHSGTPRETFWALHDVSLNAHEGEVVGVIGRNGAGKSTLLKVLAKITTPTTGRVVMRGRVASLLEVGAGFDGELSGRENVFLSGAILGMRRREIASKFDEIVEFAGVQEFIDTPVKRYSSGMFVRLAFSVGAHLDSDLLLVDEVLAVGDAEFQRRCLAKMDAIAHAGGRTIIFVSHNMSAVRRLCDRTYLLERGRIIAEGGPSDVIADHLSRSTGDATFDGVGSVVLGDASRVGSGEGRLRAATLLDSAGEPTDRLALGEPFSIQLRYDILEPIPYAFLEVGVLGSDGFPIATAMSTDGGGSELRLDPGTWIITAKLDLRMLPGSFSLSAMLHHEHGATIDVVDSIIPFSVSEISREGTESFPWSQVRGSVRPVSAWSVDVDANELTARGPST
jgi:lipopolysaccharide transport system ATP-binding protein